MIDPSRNGLRIRQSLRHDEGNQLNNAELLGR
jgi:hypothetical protein